MADERAVVGVQDEEGHDLVEVAGDALSQPTNQHEQAQREEQRGLTLAEDGGDNAGYPSHERS